MKICPKCERQNLNNATVCKACGASLNSVPNVDVLPDPEPDKRTHIGLAYLFGTLCFFIGFFNYITIKYFIIFYFKIIIFIFIFIFIIIIINYSFN